LFAPEKLASVVLIRFARDDAPISLIRIRRYVVPALVVNRARRDKVLVEVVDIFEDVALHGAGYGYVVDQASRPMNE
jgi:hypothetical protein